MQRDFRENNPHTQRKLHFEPNESKKEIINKQEKQEKFFSQRLLLLLVLYYIFLCWIEGASRAFEFLIFRVRPNQEKWKVKCKHFPYWEIIICDLAFPPPRFYCFSFFAR